MLGHNRLNRRCCAALVLEIHWQLAIHEQLCCKPAGITLGANRSPRTAPFDPARFALLHRQVTFASLPGVHLTSSLLRLLSLDASFSLSSRPSSIVPFRCACSNGRCCLHTSVRWVTSDGEGNFPLVIPTHLGVPGFIQTLLSLSHFPPT